MSTGNEVSRSTFYTYVEPTQTMNEAPDVQDQELMSSESGKVWRWTIRKFFSDRVKPFFTDTIPSAFKNFKSLFSRKIEVSENVKTLMTEHAAETKKVAGTKAKLKKAEKDEAAKQERVRALQEQLTAATTKLRNSNEAKEVAVTDARSAENSMALKKEGIINALHQELHNQSELKRLAVQEVECAGASITTINSHIQRISGECETAEAEMNEARGLYDADIAELEALFSQVNRKKRLLEMLESTDTSAGKKNKLAKIYTDAELNQEFHEVNHQLAVAQLTNKYTSEIAQIEEQITPVKEKVKQSKVQFDSAERAFQAQDEALKGAYAERSRHEGIILQKAEVIKKAQEQYAKHEAVLKHYQPSTFYVGDVVPHSLDDDDVISQASMDSYSTMRRHSEKLSLSEDILTRFPDLRHVETRS